MTISSVSLFSRPKNDNECESRGPENDWGSARVRWLREEDPRQVSVEGAGHVLARRLFEMWMLRLPTGRSRLHSLHKRKSYPLQKRLPEVGPFNARVNNHNEMLIKGGTVEKWSFPQAKLHYFQLKSSQISCYFRVNDRVIYTKEHGGEAGTHKLFKLISLMFKDKTNINIFVKKLFFFF